MQNILAKVPHGDKANMAEQLKRIWLKPARRSAERLAELVIMEYEEKYPEAMRCLEQGLEDSWQFYNFPEIDKYMAIPKQSKCDYVPFYMEEKAL